MQYVTQVSLLFLVRPSKVLFELNSCTLSTQLQQFVFFAALMRFKVSIWFFFLGGGGRTSSISLIITGPRQVDLNGEKLETVVLNPDKEITVKDTHYLYGTWESLYMEHSGHQQWICAALICMYYSSISQHLSQEMRLSLSLNEPTGDCEHKPHSYSAGLIGFSYPFISFVMFFLPWAEIFDSFGYSDQ